MTATSVTDKIEKRVVLKASQSRVWRAISDSGEFGTWFQMRFDAPFAEGKAARAQVLVKGYEHLTYSGEPTTLVEFRLEPSGQDTVLTIVESGFDQIPAARRAEAFRMNEGGWTGQVRNIERYVTSS
jgi:uncharacterized protein YndB with AHSA1/START domain